MAELWGGLWMSKWTIRQRVLWTLVLILGLTAVMAVVALGRLHQIETRAEDLRLDSLPSLRLSSQIMASTLSSYALTQEHVISVDDAYMAKLEQSLAQKRLQLEQHLRTYAAIVRSTEGRRRLAALETALPDFTRRQEQVLRLSRALHNAEAHELATRELVPAFERVEYGAEQLFDLHKQSAEQSATHIQAAVATANLGVWSSGLLALVLGVLGGVFLLRAVTTPLARLLEAVEAMRTGDLTRRITLAQQDEFAVLSEGFNRMSGELGTLVGHIQRSGLQVNTAVTEIAATAKEQQATATEIAATTAEVGATSREISATSRELARTMREVAGFAEQSAALAGGGQTGLNQMAATMNRVMEATSSIHAKLAVLSDKAANIGQVVTTINRVADQTNLLSLNAAIEAEKAGEYGRGFAVVATEIRRLADQTAIATSDIEQMVREIQSAVSAGVMGMDRFSEDVRTGLGEVQQLGAQLSQIIQQVQALAPRCEAVNDGVQAQSSGADQITQALVQLGEAAQQTVESLRQSSGTIAELNQVANGLRSAITRFKVET
jgi:methyl-accepting chemotaxis protein WspA